ncbi:MAG TPA: ABC transporter permease [Thermoanaerobaculia bacterium]|nr:ABC transporter permease [Thermoanaerobaculia bacterium]
MRKMFAVFKREYIQAVRRKAFIIMTLIFPFLFAAMMFLPGLMMARGMGVKRIVVLDGTTQLRDAFARPNEQPKADAKEDARDALRGRRRNELPTQLQVDYVAQADAGRDEVVQPYLDRLTRSKDDASRLDGVFVIPAQALRNADTKFTHYSRTATDFMTHERLARAANRSIQRIRLESNGIQPDRIEELMRDVDVESVQLSRTGDKKTGGEMNFLLGFLMAAMLLMPSLIYGTETMRGIVQEKSDRVVEVLISSVTPMQLLSGKIVGIAAVGLTQILVWVIMGSIAGGYGAAGAAAAGVNLAQFFRPIIFVYFFVFFVLAYLTYVCIYAIAGAVCNTEREAQQFIMPVMLLMLLPWMLAAPIITNPDSPLAVGFSLSPGFGPITMFIRTLVADPPLWHIALSIAVSIVTILAFFWATGKIFRVGILSYGKRPTLPELWRWLKLA